MVKSSLKGPVDGLIIVFSTTHQTKASFLAAIKMYNGSIPKHKKKTVWHYFSQASLFIFCKKKRKRVIALLTYELALHVSSFFKPLLLFFCYCHFGLGSCCCCVVLLSYRISGEAAKAIIIICTTSSSESVLLVVLRGQDNIFCFLSNLLLWRGNATFFWDFFAAFLRFLGVVRLYMSGLNWFKW